MSSKPAQVCIPCACPIEARNKSVRYMDRGYSRICIREGFYMVGNKYQSDAVILFPLPDRKGANDARK
jgi:hypothetical protein